MCCKQPLHAFAPEFSEKGGGRIRQRGLFALKCWCHANTAQRFSPSREMWSSTFLVESGRPSFSALQNYGSSSGPLLYYTFDVMIAAGKDLIGTTPGSPTRDPSLEFCILCQRFRPFDKGLEDFSSVRIQSGVAENPLLPSRVT